MAKMKFQRSQIMRTNQTVSLSGQGSERFRKKFQVTLPRPPVARDERKVWCYGTGLKGNWAAVDPSFDEDFFRETRIYSFDEESDAMLFCLTWGGSYRSVDIKGR